MKRNANTKTKTKTKTGEKKLRLVREIVVTHLGTVTGGQTGCPCSGRAVNAD